MISAILTIVSLLGVLSLSGCTPESKENLAESANIKMAQAVVMAEVSVPGTAVTAELVRKDGEPAYFVEVLDDRGTEHVAYIDARYGQPVQIDGESYSRLQQAPTQPEAK